MTAQRSEIVVLGAGPAGLGCALKLARRGTFAVTLLERQGVVGGNAGSFSLEGLTVDLGSHRLHPSCPPEVLDDLQALLGPDLLARPRHGRIRLRGRWLHFPLRPLDLALHLPLHFIAGVLRDALLPVRGKEVGASFASVLERGLGKTICREFFFPFAEKIWGLPAAELDAEQARRRVSAGSLGKLVRKVLRVLPGLRRPGGGRFFYPRRGYGQISEALHGAALDAGAVVQLGTPVRGIEVVGGRAVAVLAGEGESERRYPARQVLSTLPLPALPRLVRPAAPPEVLACAAALRYRALLLVYLVLDADRFTPFDAHYFPEKAIPIARLSEPKNYSLAHHPGTTVLCAELPCTEGDELWRASDDELQAVVQEGLDRAGLPVRVPVRRVVTRRLAHAYPLYTRGYRAHFEALDSWAAGIDGLLPLGRQGLFVHDNAHHALAMAYAASACITPAGDLDRARWAEHRRQFESHVVED